MAMSGLLGTRLALPFRNANYGIYAAGNAVSLIGTWMQRISVGWLAWQLTHSGLWLGIIAFADFFPVVLIGPIAGAAADHWDRLWVVKTSQVMSLVQASMLFALAALDQINIWLLVGLTAFQGGVVAFNQPARLALVPSLVTQADLASAVAINSVIFNLARFVGPMLAGVALVWSGVSIAFAANALSYLVFLLALTRVNVDFTNRVPAKPRGLAADLREGISYTTRHPAITALLLLLIAIGIGSRPLNDLLPGFAAEVFRSGAGGLSLLASATGGGAILGGLWLGHRADSAGLTRIATRASVGGAVAAAAVAATDKIWLAIPAIMAFGFCLSSAGIAIQTLVQLSSDRSMRGRVMGLYGLIFRGAPAIGGLSAGAASTYFGLRWPVVLGAMLVLAASAWTWRIRAQIETALPGETPGLRD